MEHSRDANASLWREPRFPPVGSFKTNYLSISPETLGALLSAPLRRLSLGFTDPSHWQKLDGVFNTRLKLKDLSNLVFDMVSPENISSLTKLLFESTHIQLLSIGNTPDSIVEESIVPTRGSGIFTSLTSLSLHWQGPGFKKDTAPHIAQITEESLAALGTLISLRQLRLIVGNNFGWPHQWLIDHDAIVAHLRPLRQLERLALCRDTYERHGLDEHEFEAYYERQDLWSGEGITYARPELDEETGYFAKAHRRMEEAWEAEMKRQVEILDRFRDQTMRERAAQDANESPDFGSDHVDENAGQNDDGIQDHQDDTIDIDDNDDNDENDANDIDDAGSEHDGNQENTEDGDVQSSDQSEDENDNQWSESHDPRYDKLSTDELWELSHCNFILCEAERYADTFPKLEWIYIGQCPIKIQVPGDGSCGNAVPVSDERDSCRSLLNKWFNLEEVNDDRVGWNDGDGR